MLDHNQHIVPDGTSLSFQIGFPEENIGVLYLDTYTSDGMAQADYTLERQGVMQVSSFSEPAKNSTVIRLLVGEEPGFVTALAPTNSLELTPTIALTPTISGNGSGNGDGVKERAGWDTLIVLLLILGVFSAAIAVFTNHPGWSSYRWRILLGSLVGGLAGYDLIVIGFTGATGMTLWGGRWSSVVVGMAGGILGAVLGWGSMAWKRE